MRCKEEDTEPLDLNSALIVIVPFYLSPVLLICRWDRHSSQAATSLSNLHGTRVRNQVFQLSRGSDNGPVKPM